jgi:drug/metabolite transporter (DMT)-like permease
MGQQLVAHALGRIPATASSIILLAQAPITALLAWPLLGEPLHRVQILGGAFVLAGIVVVNLDRLSARTSSVPREVPATRKESAT